MSHDDEQPARAWRLVLETIEADLLQGRLGPGDRLPSERELASSLGVGRSSVREALRVLEVLGLIRTGSGSGPTSGAIITATPRGALSSVLRLQVAARAFPFDDVVEARLMLESAVVERLAADPDRELDDVWDLLRAMDAPDLSREEFLALDQQMHGALAEATGNAVVAATMAGLRTSVEAYVLDGAARIPDWEGAAAGLRREHRAILDAVEAGDGAGARQLVRDHIAGYWARVGMSPSR
ncbi:FCD domain-containing protein [Microbacterium sp. X-17]|uniref:FadR/GntR family transcriptional regulator n=1 Tax=Microbacterium sp. X-17 TaxID=3144404 RepID=UPI0031F4C5A7